MTAWHFRFKRLSSNREGASAVEFALVAPLALVLIFAILEGGWIMTQSIMFDRALAKTLRQIQLQNAVLSYDEIKERVCEEATILPDCTKAIRVELTPIERSTDFPSQEANCVDRSVKVDPVTSYDAGKPSQIVFARACFIVDPIMPGLGLGLSLPKDQTGGIRLTSSFAFVNE